MGKGHVLHAGNGMGGAWEALALFRGGIGCKTPNKYHYLSKKYLSGTKDQMERIGGNPPVLCLKTVWRAYWPSKWLLAETISARNGVLS